MRKYSSLAPRKSTHLPQKFHAGHDLCFMIHDVLTQMLVSGREASIFNINITFRDNDDLSEFKKNHDVFEWLEKTRRVQERANLLVTIVFPAVLSDMLHCFYEALETSRKGKLGISFMLLRKPLQESLFLLESVIVDRHDFAENLTSNPLKLHSQGAGGVDVHTKRIQRVLDILGETRRFDANYLSRLRYDKEAGDGFDGICNKAMHLFTGHRAITTEPLNVNFIFSGADALVSQWSYLYSRLPYILFYIRQIVEFVSETIAPTDPVYLRDMDRRISATVLLWWDTVEDPYDEPHLRAFAVETRAWLLQHCREAACREPTPADLKRMADTGAYPGERKTQVDARIRGFEVPRSREN